MKIVAWRPSCSRWAWPRRPRRSAPSVDHQPSPCTVPEKPVSLCACITDDGQVAASRIYFRPAGEKFYSFVDMVFGGLSFCGTVPGPRAGKVQTHRVLRAGGGRPVRVAAHEHLQHGRDPRSASSRPSRRTPARAAAIMVHATNQKQGKKLPEEFVATGVSFVPVTR